MPISMNAKRPLTPNELVTVARTYGSTLVLVRQDVSLVFRTRKGQQYQWIYRGDLAVKNIDRLAQVVGQLQEKGHPLVYRDERVHTQEPVPAAETPTVVTHTCAGKTRSGKPCTRVVANQGDLCYQHQPVERLPEPAFSTIEEEPVKLEEKQFVPRPDATDELMAQLGILTAARAKK